MLERRASLGIILERLASSGRCMPGDNIETLLGRRMSGVATASVLKHGQSCTKPKTEVDTSSADHSRYQQRHLRRLKADLMALALALAQVPTPSWDSQALKYELRRTCVEA